MDFSFRMAEERIKEAERNGEFDNLPGKGKPLDLSKMNAVPEDLRMSYTILKNANMLPEEMQIKKELATIEELIAQCTDDELLKNYRKEWNEKTIRFQSLMEKRKLSHSSAYRQYRTSIHRRMG
ncbi:DnaJ family domain-containing protein [Pontibacillus litoralis]|uniref:Molecular chaperone DnaJ n=1 Tax=Pontibacillus litoralis JSM 072002 TaxID=1385512 RepID=A0A0A5GAE7_9BACI|nr:DUF1992 domain-containing protein [Pontibacillus litoralis]KGX88173.1 molecular chaperone DnaJ [Pontibacillus litoralis JSM 072002]